MSTQHDDHDHSHHNTESDSRTQKHHTPEQTQALEERARKIEALLVAKGLVNPATLDKMAETYERDLGPMNGAKVVAHAWVDPAYKKRLLTNATAAIGELGFSGLQGEHMVVIENTPKVHNVVTCTLCSCYPWPVLGLPPTWYKSAPYRSRIVIDPRNVLREFGTDLEPDQIVISLFVKLIEQFKYPLLGSEREMNHQHAIRGNILSL